SLQVPWQSAEHEPAQLVTTPMPSVSQLPPVQAEHSPSQRPLQVPSQPAATSSWQSPEQLPVHSKFGAWPVHSRVPIAWQSAATSAETSHEPMHLASIEPGPAVTSHSAAASTATSTDA